MIRHIVMWRVRGDTPSERLDLSNLIKDKFEGLRGQIPGLLSVQVGVNFNAVEIACDAVLVTDFESKEHLRAYATHPEHLRVRDELLGVRIERYQVDYEVAAVSSKLTQSATAAIAS